MKRLIKTHGSCTIGRSRRDPFHVLCTSIISQQLSVKAADTIQARVATAVLAGAAEKGGFMPAHFIEVFRTCYGPVHKLYAALDAERQAGLTRELFALLEQHNRADDGTLVVPGEYMEVVIERK